MRFARGALRAGVAALAVGSQLALSGAVAGASSAPTPATARASATVLPAAIADPTSLPLAVQIGAVTPASVTPHTDVTVSGTIATIGPTVRHLHMVLRARGLGRRADLASLRTSQSTDGYALATGTESAGGPQRTVRAGHIQRFRATFSGDDLIAISGSSDLAAALIVGVRGTAGTSGITSGTGEAGPPPSELGHTVVEVPVVPSTPQAPPIVSFVVPLTAPPTNPLGSAPLPTEATVSRVEAHLKALVDGADQAGEKAQWLTLAVDPALVEQLCATAGCDTHPALPNVPKALASHARSALSLLRQAATTNGIQLSALPYADADIDAILRAGQADRLRELIGDAGTQLHDLLGVAAPHVDPALPPDGELTKPAVDELISLGTGTAIVSDAMLPVAAGLVSNIATQSASSNLTGSRGLTLPALVTDSGLEAMVGSADGGTEGLAASSAEGLLAETGAIAAELPNADQRSIVVLAPRLWNATGKYVHDVTLGLGSATWLEHGTLAQATALPGVARTQSLVTGPEHEVPVATIEAIARLRDDVAAATELPSAPTKAKTQALQATVREPLLAALARASSAWWRTDPAQANALTDAVRARTQKILHGVSVSVASSVLVTGSSGRVPVQLENTLDFAVAVRVELTDDAGRLARFSRVFPLPAATEGRSGKAQEELTVTSRSAGRFAAQLQLATPSGVLLGDSQAFQVRSQNYGTIAVGITAGALFLLVVAFVVRGVRALRRRRSRRLAANPA